MTGAMTMAEKVLARASGRERVRAGEFVTARIDRVMAHEAFTLCALNLARLGIDRLFDPDRVVVILDHYFPANTERMAQGHVLGTDSHSTTYGALGAAGAGIGLTEMTWVLATGELWFQVPPSVRFDLGGTLPPGLMSKDVVLHLAGRFGTEVAQYKAIEYAGEAARALSMASRMTMANMGTELGAKFAFFEADATALDYLSARIAGDLSAFGPDPEASYEATHEVDVARLEPQIACPHSPGNVKPVSEVVGTRIDQAFLGSCTNARLEDLAVAAEILGGRKVHPRTRLIVTPASQRVYLEATKRGYTERLLEAGAHITASGCGACPGGHNGIVGAGEACLSSTNRNFQGRMGSPEAQVYLGSPASVAAAAVAGEIVDPRTFWTAPVPRLEEAT
jgi:3-isopropylmalate/(R)-2-methylmalate dehydratase large subunit